MGRLPLWSARRGRPLDRQNIIGSVVYDEMRHRDAAPGRVLPASRPGRGLRRSVILPRYAQGAERAVSAGSERKATIGGPHGHITGGKTHEPTATLSFRPRIAALLSAFGGLGLTSGATAQTAATSASAQAGWARRQLNGADRQDHRHAGRAERDRHHRRRRAAAAAADIRRRRSSSTPRSRSPIGRRASCRPRARRTSC